MIAGIVVDIVANGLVNYMGELKGYNIVPILCEAVLHIASYSPPDRS